MVDRNEAMDEITSVIIEYLNNENQWSHFSSHEGTTRGAIYKHFFDFYDQITGDQINDTVISRISRDLTDKESQKLEQIVIAWQEWTFILNLGERLNRIELK